MNIHPVADLFPMLTDEELDVLAEDIQANGLRNPIVTYEGQVLDGRNRLAACERIGVEPTFVEYEGDSPVAFIVSQNMQRRDLDPNQKACIALELLPPLQEESRKRRAAVLVQNGSVPPALEERGEAIEHAARMVGVSRTYVAYARRLSLQDPGLYADVRTGVRTLNMAVEILANPILNQDPDLLAEVKRGDVSVSRAVMILRQRQAGLVDMAPPATRRRDTATVEDRDEPLLRQDEDVTRIPAWQIADAVGALLRYAKSDKYWDLPETVLGWQDFSGLLAEFFDVALPKLEEYAKTITERKVA